MLHENFPKKNCDFNLTSSFNDALFTIQNNETDVNNFEENFWKIDFDFGKDFGKTESSDKNGNTSKQQKI